MSLFQNSVVSKYLKNQNATLLVQKWEAYKNHFLNLKVQEDIKGLKEEQYQGEFLEDLFVKILGYTKPASSTETKFNLTTEYKNVKDSKKADGAIIINDKVIAVIELKGTNTTDLGKIETQAFGYKNNQPDCVYVITSNFEKIRFYIDNAIEFLEFNLFQLTKTEFELLYLCLAYDNLSKGIAKTIKDESVSQEDVITKKLYKDYSLFKRELYQNLVALNPQYEPIELFKKSQKLLDRFLFIFFAEDRNLLPTNLIFRINKEWQNLRTMRIEVSLYDRYKIYFNDLNSGAKVQLPAFSQTTSNVVEEHQIFAYNGGLFKADAILDHIKIDDAVLFKHTENLSNYDFASEVDVNILGHIFENSLNELDEIKAQLEGESIDKTKTKRKKDGVFYTPKYITKYIVENTIGKLCQEKKTELQLVDEDYTTDKKRQKKTLQALIDKVETYRSWLLQLTICDPACGSGAFLNQALDFLIAQHQYIDELKAKLFGDTFVLSDVENSILENNLFGVDLNEESVEIAKLSLWLRTAQPNRKLNDLSGNIQCGNSLIDDVAVAGDKAFNWQTAFPQVFVNGGFDVIIGNPPYVRVQGLKENYYNQTIYYEQKYISATGNYDIYAIFMEKCFDLINKKGIVSFILPHKFLVTDFGVGIRDFFKQKTAVESIVHFGSELVFNDASTYTCIINLTLTEKEKVLFKKIHPNELMDDSKWDYIKYNNLSKENWDLQSEKIFDVIEKLKKQPYTVENVFDNIFQGIATSLDEVFVFEGKKEGGFIKGYNKKYDYHFEVEQEMVKPFIKGNEISKYQTPVIKNFVVFPYKIEGNKATPFDENYIKNNLPKTYSFLKHFEEQIKGREKGRMNVDEFWYLYIYPKSLVKFQNPKIMTQEISLGCNMTYDEDGEYYHPTTIYSFVKNDKFEVDEKYYLGILNSKVMWFFLKNTGTELGGGYFRFKTNYLKPFPLPEISNTSETMITNVNQMLSLNKTLQQQQAKVINMLQRDYGLTKPTKKLDTWYELTVQDFFKELAKAKIVLSAIQKDEVQEYFETYQKQAVATKNQITATDKQIDAMVYELYGLSNEEIEIVENS
ncbi:TPA: N-6 DNA methylase [Flavobacterium psychrophilum]